MTSRLRCLAIVLALGLSGCGEGSDDPPSATPTPTADFEIVVEGICLGDPAGLTPTACTYFPTRTPTPTPIHQPASATISCFTIDRTPAGPCPTRMALPG